MRLRLSFSYFDATSFIGVDHELTVTYDGSKDVNGVTMYMDGVDLGINVQNSLTSDLTASSQHIYVPDNGFTGDVFRVLKYSKELTQEEVTELVGQ